MERQRLQEQDFLGHFRNGRNPQHHRFVKLPGFLKLMFLLMGLWKPLKCNFVICVIIGMISLYQLGYDLYIVISCRETDCRFVEDATEAKHMNKSNRRTENTAYALGALGSAASYICLAISLLVINRNKKALEPSHAIEDISGVRLCILCISMVICLALFVSSVVVSFISVVPFQRKDNFFCLMVTGAVAQFLAQCAAIVGIHLFGVSSLALGTLADDTIRRIKEIRTGQRSSTRTPGYGSTSSENTNRSTPGPSGEGKKTTVVETVDSNKSAATSDADTENGASTENTDSSHDENSTGDQGNFFRSRELDQLIEIHEELCDIVCDTVSEYSVWFVLHWIIYGLEVIVIIIFLSEEISNNSKYHVPTLSFVFYSLQIVINIYLFVMPCCCAAFITNTCGGMYDEINKTTSQNWPTDHPFKDRRHIAIFLSYAKERQCSFKIGRITFTSGLAWFSLLLGAIALLFHFFTP